MRTSGNTILITGGGSGIGFELAKQFIAHNNTVVICGRRAGTLEEAFRQLPDVITIQCDVTNADSVDHMISTLQEKGLSINMIVNNAAKANAYVLGSSAHAEENAVEEINTNYLAVVRLTEKFLAQLILQREAAIINITSVVAVVPGVILPTYSASKAALHSYTQSLRLSLSKFPNVGVFEVMPPLVDTEFSRELSSHDKMPPAKVALDVIEGIASDKLEMHLGATSSLFAMHKKDAFAALAAMNRLVY